MSAPGPVVRLENVSKIYRTGSLTLKALDDVSLCAEEGEFLLLHGPSGSGKTTLLNIVGCLARPTRGRYWLDGEDISHFPEHFLAKLRRERLGCVSQQYNLIAGYSVLENVTMALLPAAIPAKQRAQRAKYWLHRLGLLTRSNFLANELSGGEQQRAALARALAAEPSILLADEPIASIDARWVETVIEIFQELKQSGKTVLLSSHLLPAGMEDLIDRTISLADGQVTA